MKRELFHMMRTTIKKLSWTALVTILFCCVFSTQLNAQLACPTAVASCDDVGGLVITFDTPADAAAFAAANPFLFNFNIWANAMVAGNQITYTNASIFPASAICPDLGGIMNATGCSSACADFSSVATGNLNAGIIESTCNTIGGTPAGGSITAPATNCPANTTLEYNVDGAGWVTTLPTYNQTTSITVETRCTCNDDSTMSSEVSTVTTMPGICPDCPTINVQPAGQGFCPGDDVTLEITINGGAGAASYQWQSDCSGTFMNIAGATSSTFTITNAQTADACNYKVIITETANCNITSDPATLT